MPLTDKDLIKSIKKYKCSDCIPELKNRHIGLIMQVYGRYQGILKNYNFNNHDFNDEVNYLVYDAAKKFDGRRKTKFSTWLCDQTRYYCLNKINELKKKKTVESEPDVIIHLMDECFKDSNSSKLKSAEMCDYVFDILGQLKDPRIIDLFRMRYFDGNYKLPWKLVALKLGVTSQTCINLHNKAIKFLKEKLTSKEFYDSI